MIAPAYTSPDGSIVIFRADAMDVLPQLEQGSVDAVITDPPYSSGGMTRGDRMLSTGSKYEQSGQALKRSEFTGDNRDGRSFAYWCDLWLRLCRRATKPGGAIAMFTDWRQLPVTTDAIQSAGWVWRGIAVWDKTQSARPQMGRPRAQAEYIVWGSHGPVPAELSKRIGCLPGVFAHRVSQVDKHHLTGKPSNLMADVVRLCPPGGTVLDPFAGSGSTAIGCIRTGRRFVGTELDEANVAVAVARIEQELSAAGGAADYARAA